MTNNKPLERLNKQLLFVSLKAIYSSKASSIFMVTYFKNYFHKMQLSRIAHQILFCCCCPCRRTPIVDVRLFAVICKIERHLNGSKQQRSSPL